MKPEKWKIENTIYILQPWKTYSAFKVEAWKVTKLSVVSSITKRGIHPIFGL